MMSIVFPLTYSIFIFRILANHKHKKAIPIGKFKAKEESNEVPVKPRGSGPSFRFSKSTTVATPTKPIQQARKPIKTPKLEFGFKPIIGIKNKFRNCCQYMPFIII